jgi:hypothetical protein
MGMGKIHWREEVDPNIIRIKDRDIFYVDKRYFFQYLFWRMFLPSVGCRVGLRVYVFSGAHQQNFAGMGLLLAHSKLRCTSKH